MGQGEAGERWPDAVGESEPGESPGGYRDTGESPPAPASRMANGWPVAIGAVSVPDALGRIEADLGARPVATGEPASTSEPEYASPRPFAVALVFASGLLLAGACVFAVMQSSNPKLPARPAGSGVSVGEVALATPSARGGRTTSRPAGAPTVWGGAAPGGDQGADRGGSGQGRDGRSSSASPRGSATGSTTRPAPGATPAAGKSISAVGQAAPEPQRTAGSATNPPSAQAPAG